MNGHVISFAEARETVKNMAEAEYRFLIGVQEGVRQLKIKDKIAQRMMNQAQKDVELARLKILRYKTQEEKRIKQ